MEKGRGCDCPRNIQGPKSKIVPVVPYLSPVATERGNPALPLDQPPCRAPREDKGTRTSSLSPCSQFPLSPELPISLCVRFSSPRPPNPSHGAREDSRRLWPPLINRLDRKVRLGVLYVPAKPFFLGSSTSPGFFEIPQVPHRASPSISSPITLPVPRRPSRKVRVDLAHPPDHLALSIEFRSFGFVDFFYSVPRHRSAITDLVRSGDQKVAAPPFYGSP